MTKEFCIYRWYNKKTKKSYIGKTYYPKNRYLNFVSWEKHYAGPHIDRARKKYNDIKYWDYSILCHCNSEEELSNMEKYYISLYKSNDKYKGYNISSGGTWGDTFYSLTNEEREKRLEKRKKTIKEKEFKLMNNGIIQKKIDKYHQQEYLENGWQYGMLEETKQKVSNTLKNSEKHKEACRKRRLSEEEKEIRKEQHKKEMEEWHNSEEYKQLIELNKEKARQRRIEYNKSEKHREAATESNKKRWKNGCPEKTSKKMSNSRKKHFREKKIRWITDDIEEKMIDLSELNIYKEQGYHLGRLRKNDKV